MGTSATKEKEFLVIKPTGIDKFNAINKFLHKIREDFLKINSDIISIINKWIEVEFDHLMKPIE
jgi:hypothetical protein